MAEAKVADDGEKLDVATANWPSAITERERGLAQQAMSEFKGRNYDACLGTLNALAATRSQDLKVMLNKAVAEYYKSGLLKTKDFRRALTEICSKVSLEDVISVYDADHCFLYYNQAVILYHGRQYQAAFHLLEKFIPFIEELEQIFPEKIPYFLFELHVSAIQPDKAINLINHIEKSFVNVSTKPGNLEKEEAMKAEGEAGRSSHSGLYRCDSWKSIVCQFRIRSYLMLKMVKPAKSTLKVLTGLIGMMTPNLVFLKSQFELVRGNFLKAARILNSAPEIFSKSPPGSPLALMFFNNMAVIHFNMHRPNMTLYYLNEAVQQNVALYCRPKKADAKDSDASDLNKAAQARRTLKNLGGSQHHVLTYNMGINLLQCGQYQQAFDCLLETVQIYCMNPRLWLRLAECCVMANRQSNDDDRKLLKKQEVIQQSIGSGVHHKLIVGCGLMEDLPNVSTEPAAMPMATMEFASLCLDNALLCLNSPVVLTLDTVAAVQTTAPAKQEAETNKSSQSIFVQALPGNPLTSEEEANLRCSVLALKSYVSLYHNDHLVALACAEELSRQPRISGVHRYLAHMYKAEALVGLDRLSDAMQNLNPDVVTDISTAPSSDQTTPATDKSGERATSEPPEDKRFSYPWSPKDLPTAKALVMYNLAATYAIRGDYEKASNHLSKSMEMVGNPLPVQMNYLKIYLDLMQGHKNDVRRFINEDFGYTARF